MTSIPDDREYLPINRTFVPALPHRSRLTLKIITPECFVVTYPVEPGQWFRFLLLFPQVVFGILAAFAASLAQHFWFIPWWITFLSLTISIPWLMTRALWRWFRSPEGGRVALNRQELHAESGVFFRFSNTYPIEADSRLEIIDHGGSESHVQLLSLHVDQQWKSLVQPDDLIMADQHWLCRQMNAWLGYEFPSHCVACGHQFDIDDVDWPQRSVNCSACGFTGLETNPFPSQIVPPSPQQKCPCCRGMIWLRDVNRETGGCRCQRCHWASEALPPMPIDTFADSTDFFFTAMNRAIPVVLALSDKFVPQAQLQQEFPAPASARRQFEAEGLIETDHPEQLILSFGHWQTQHYYWLLIALGTALLLSCSLLWVCSDLAQRTWLQWLGRTVSVFLLPVSGGLVAALIWWGRQRVRLIYAREALLVQIGKRQRVVRWKLVKDLATHEHIWPPAVYLAYGGTGVMIFPPSHAAARAMTRLCQLHCEQAGHTLPR